MKTLKTFLNFTNQNESVEVGKISNDEILSIIKSGDSAKIRQLLKSCITDLNVVNFCINNGLDPNFDSGLPIRYAVKVGNLEVVKLLISKGVDKLMDDKVKGLTVGFAYEYGYQNIIDYLIQIQGFNKNFGTAMDWIGHSHKLSTEKKVQILKDIQKMVEDGTVEIGESMPLIKRMKVSEILNKYGSFYNYVIKSNHLDVRGEYPMYDIN